MYAISKSEEFQVIGFNRDGSQQRLCSAASLMALLTQWAKDVLRHEKSGRNNILPSFKKISVWNVSVGFTSLELPYIPTVDE